jgi:hypothetical protein
MGITDHGSAGSPIEPTAPLPVQGDEDAAASLRHSMYQLAGSSRGRGPATVIECFIPLFLFASIYELSRVLDRTMGLASMHDAPSAGQQAAAYGNDPSSAVDVANWSAHSLNSFVVLSFWVLGLATLGTLGYVIHEALGQVRRRALLELGSLGLAATLFGVAFHARATGASALIERLVADHSTAEQLTLYRAMYASGNAIVLLVACAMCAVLIPDLQAKAVRIVSNHDILFLARRMRWMRALLYSVAPFLVISAAAAYVAVDAVVSVPPGDESAMLAQKLTGRSTLHFGALYSLLLACIYAPVEAILRIRAMKLASDANVNPTERIRWLEERNLKLNAINQLKTFGALLSPALAPIAAGIAQDLQTLLTHGWGK